VHESAVLQLDAAAVREQPLVERAQVIAPAVEELAPGGLAGVATRFERRDDRVHVAGRKRALVLRHDTLSAQIRIALQQGGRCRWRPVTAQMLW
jgi:hypothetical protein